MSSLDIRNTAERQDTINAMPDKRKRDDDVISISSTDSDDEGDGSTRDGRSVPETSSKRLRPPDRTAAAAPQDHFILPDPQVFSHPSQQFRMGLNPDPANFR